MRNVFQLLCLTCAGVALVSINGCATTKPAQAQVGGPTTAQTAGEIALAGSEAVIPSDVMTRYTVVEDDHLWGIASRRDVYADPYHWPLIYKANSDRVEDADLIHPDQVLVIPRNYAPDDAAAAVRHARTRGAWSLGVTESSDLAYLGR